jgi:hypothetical protein
MSEYTNGPITIFDSVPVGTSFTTTTSDFPTNPEVSDDGSGGLYATGLALLGFAPVATFSTGHIAAMLGFVGINGQCVGAGKAVTKVELFQRKLETCKSPLSGTPHLRHAVTTGLLRLGSLAMPRAADATLSAMLDTFTDGTNAPVVETDGVALPTTVLTARYRLGSPKIANVLFPEVDNMDLAFNVEISDKSPELNTIWPDQAGVLTVRPVLTLRGRNLSRVKATLIELGANGATHVNTIVQLRKILSGASFEDYADPVHIAITLAGMAVPTNLASSSAGGRSTNEIVLTTAEDAGGNAPVLVDLEAAYDTTP